MWKNIPSKIWKYWTELNIFPNELSVASPYELETQRISTKVFLLSLLLSSYILFIYTATSTSVRTFTVTKPSYSIYEQLDQQHGQTLTCPCSQVSTRYQSFITIEYSLHPICSSMYIHDRWFQYLAAYSGPLWSLDFRYIGRYSFQALKSLCQLADESIGVSLGQFYSSRYVTATLTSNELFKTQIEAIIDQFITATTNSFLLSLRMISNTTQTNGLLSGLFTNAMMEYRMTVYFIMAWKAYSSCNCQSENTCMNKVGIVTGDSSNPYWEVPGFYLGCYILEALRKSDLHCFFDEVCLNDLQIHLEVNETFMMEPLSLSSLQESNPETLIGMIVDALLVEEWKWNITHQEYFGVCHPKECFYTTVSRDNLAVILINFIGLLGGLVTALKVIVPRIVWLARSKFDPANQRRPALPLKQQLLTIPNKILCYLRDYNLFPSIQTANNTEELKTQRISTKVFLLSLLFFSYILFIYTGTSTSVRTFTVTKPSYSIYEQLDQQHGQTLTCPCSQVSTRYQSFITIEYSLHPICSSVYINDSWFRYLELFDDFMIVIDFRYVARNLFQGLRSLCQLAEESIRLSLDQFYSLNHITAVLDQRELLLSHLESIIEQFILSTKNEFLLSLRTIENTAQVNGLASALLTNYWFTSSSRPFVIDTVRLTYDDDCICSYSSSCITTSCIFNYTSTGLVQLWEVPGFYHGCFILVALRKSDLHCLYNQSCLDMLQSYFNTDQNTSFMALDPSLLNQFDIDTQLGTVVDSLMVQTWASNVSHMQYFDSCRPQECVYTIISRKTWLGILTMMISLIGGLVTALKLIVPRLVRFIRRYWRQRNIVSEVATPIQKRLRTCGHQILQYLKQLNIFRTLIILNNTHDVRIQLITTRLFIGTFLISFIVLLIHTTTVTVIYTFTIMKPSRQQYNQLYRQYSQVLKCPCSQISTEFSSFIDIEYSFHPICHSIYIDDEWIQTEWSNQDHLSGRDFRSLGSHLFVGLQSLCQLAEKSIRISLDRFFSDSHVGMLVTDEELLQSQSDAIIRQFITSTASKFLLSLRTIANTTQANALASAFFTNFYFSLHNVSLEVRTEWTRYDDDCNCAFDTQCKTAAAIYASIIPTVAWDVPGFYSGCFILEALQQSDLRCFFDPHCLDDLRAHLDFNRSILLTTLYLPSTSKFKVDTPLRVIVDSLMVDEWKWNISHSKYFATCQPKECSYILMTTRHLIDIVTTILGLIGGLIKVEQFIIPKLVSVVVRSIRRRKQNKVSSEKNMDLSRVESIQDT